MVTTVDSSLLIGSDMPEAVSGVTDWAGPLAGVVLALVLAVAAASKLVDRTRVATEFAAMDLPAPQALSWLVPVAELAVAVGLVVVRPWAAVAAFGLLAVFTAVLASILRSGVPKPCNCFGSLSSGPVSTLHLVRNGVLMALAVLAAVAV